VQLVTKEGLFSVADTVAAAVGELPKPEMTNGTCAGRPGRLGSRMRRTQVVAPDRRCAVTLGGLRPPHDGATG